jgi:hypothetical protein
VSDQDFFFDDDEKPAAKSDNKTAKKAGAPASRPASKGTPAPAPAQSVTMTMAILFAVIGVLLGVVIGLFVGNMLNPVGTNAVAPAATVAPTLTQDQLNSGQLPAGHPAITGGASSTPAPSKTTTK